MVALVLTDHAATTRTPALSALRSYLDSTRPGHRDGSTWTPEWAQP